VLPGAGRDVARPRRRRDAAAHRRRQATTTAAITWADSVPAPGHGQSRSLAAARVAKRAAPSCSGIHPVTR
jgi:hypothetical protein